MTSIFDANQVFVKELVRMFKFGNVFEFYNIQKVKIGEAKEEEISGFKKVMKMTRFKSMLPFVIGVYDSVGSKIVTLRKPFKWWMQEVHVFDAQGQEIGIYKQKFKFFKPTFHLFDKQGVEFAKIHGNMVGWTFNISSMDGKNLGVINKKFAGIAKELFTTSDNYMVRFEPSNILNKEQKMILTSVACVIDMIFKEYK